MEKQKTIKKEIKISGIGIHTGKEVELIFKRAKENSGINFVRNDLPGRPVVQASIANVLDKYLPLRRTSLGVDSVEVHTVEHLLSVLFAMGIDNVLVHLDGVKLEAENWIETQQQPDA